MADAPGRPRISENPTRIACPWHGWEYDLDSGQSFMGAGQAGVRSYGVGSGRWTLLDEDRVRRGRARPGPYVAETFEVQVEDEYVVLEA